MSDQAEADLIATLKRGKEAAKPNTAVELSRTVNTSLFWMAFSLDAEMKTDLKKSLAEFPKFAEGMKEDAAGKAVTAALPAIENLKGITATFDITATEDLKITASVVCKSADDATKIKAAADAVFAMGKKMMDDKGGPGPMPIPIPPGLQKDVRAITFQAKDANVTISLQISNQTIQELAKMGDGF
jgi:hypothetical protein